MKPRAIIPFGFALACLAGGGCTKHSKQSRLIARGDQEVLAGRYDDAEGDYKAAVKLDPADAVANRQLGMLFANEGRPAPAYFLLKNAAKLEPKNFDLLLRLGQVEQLVGGFLEARAAAKALVDLHAPTEESLVLLVTTSATQADLDESRTIVAGLRSRDQDRACYHVAAGALLLFKKDPAGAEAEFRQVLALDPKSSAAYAEIGDCDALRHDLKGAGEAYQAAAELSPLRSAHRLRAIDFQIRNGAAAEGKQELAELTQKAPDYIPGLVYAMKLAFDERRYDDCAATVQKILARDDHDYDALLQLGTLKLAQQKNYDGAIAALEKAETLFPRSAAIKYQLAVAHAGKGETGRAEASLEQAIQLAPDSAQAVVMLADLHVRGHDPDSAIAALTRLQQQDPHSPLSGQIYLVLARAYQAKSSPEQMLVALRSAQQLYPQNPQVPYLIGMALSVQGKRAAAVPEFEKAWELGHNFGPALEMLVDADLQDHRYAAASQRVEAALQKFPKIPGPLLLRAKVRMAQQDFAGAGADLRRAIELDPKSPLAYLLLAKIDFTAHQGQAGADELQRLTDQTNNPASIMELGLVHTQLQQFDAARADYERLLKLDPKFVPAMNNLAYLDAENLGQLEQAEAIAKQARQLRPEDPAIADTLGWIDYRKGDYPGALVLIQEAAERNPTEPEFMYHLGMTHYMLGEEDAARISLQPVAAGAGSSPAKTDARWRLEVMAIDPATAPSAVSRELEQRVAQEPNDPIARFRLASIQMKQGNAADAATNFEALVKLHPRDLHSLLALIQLYSGPLKNPTRARDLAKSAHEMEPSDPQISAVLGQLYYQTGEFTRSVSLLETASLSLPDRLDLAWALARAQYTIGQVDQAETTLQALLQTDTAFAGRPQAESYAAMIAAAKDPTQASGALTAASKLLVTEPGCIPALMIVALTEEGSGDFAAAGSLYEKILSADSLFTPAMRQLALLYFHQLNNEERAYKLATDARATFPDDAELNKVIGVETYKRADYASAARAFQRVLIGTDDDREALFFLGMSHYRLNQKYSATSELKRALERGLDTQETTEAQSALQAMGASTAGP